MNTKDLIEAIEKGDSLKITRIFEHLIAQRIQSQLEEMKAAVSKNIFETANRAFGVPQEPVAQGPAPADVKSASEPVTKKKTSNPEIVVNEVLSADDPSSKWIHDFVHSDNPKFADKSTKERQQMALAAWYAAKRKQKGED